jgi:tRNA-specific 2-thiouridylase
MSGGVDSSVAAYLLKQQGYKVIGLFMKNWEEEGCPAVTDYEDVVSVCERLEIPYYSVNFSKEYWESVFTHFIHELSLGYTPNPDILCNKEIKFKVLLQKALEIGGDYLATGHYARVGSDFSLLRGLDGNKDQSYFLYTLKQDILRKVLFPVGDLPKPEVRRIAKEIGLVTSEKKDSVGICFIGKRNFKEFVSKYIPYREGVFKTLEGKTVGRHDGAAYYTLGQRKGLGIGGAGEAWFVVRKDVKENVVFVAQGDDHEALYSEALFATDVSFVGDQPSFPCRCTAKVRYRQEDQSCTIEGYNEGVLFVRFDKPQRAVTERQSIVFYEGEVCLGGAVILKTAVIAEEIQSFQNSKC